jgi:spermidine/putrescine transport system substrate-binding protein
MKKIIKLLLLVPLLLMASSCTKNNRTLYILNWGDYINYDLIDQFEKLNDVEVVISEVESNEAMYEQIKHNRTSFDIAFPSDYMIEQLDHDKLLKPIAFKQLKNYHTNDISPLAKNYGPKSNKYVPYFNGTIGLMYNKTKIPHIEQIVKKHGWKVLFDHSLMPKAKIGMYNSSRDAFASALLNKHQNINTTNPRILKQAQDQLQKMNYTIFGDDNLKKSVAIGNLDVALVYSGDYFEELIIAHDEHKKVNFGYYTPSNTNYWLDGMVIPKHTQNYQLALKFIDFMLAEKNALNNVKYVGYATAQTNVMDRLNKERDFAFLTKNPFYDPLKIKGLKPQAYRYLGLDYMTKLEEMFANVKR